MDAVKQMQDLQDREMNILLIIRRGYFAWRSLFCAENAPKPLKQKGLLRWAGRGAGEAPGVGPARPTSTWETALVWVVIGVGLV